MQRQMNRRLLISIGQLIVRMDLFLARDFYLMTKSNRARRRVKGKHDEQSLQYGGTKLTSDYYHEYDEGAERLRLR